MLVNDTEKSGEFEDWRGNDYERWKIMKSPENLRIWKEMIVKDTEKSGEFEDWKRNGCKRYWKVRRIWGLEKKSL